MVELLKYLALAVSLLPQVYHAVKTAEELVRAAQAGATKKELVLNAVGAVLDVADDFAKGLDKERVLRIVDKLIDAVVAVLNAIGEFKHGEQGNPTQA